MTGRFDSDRPRLRLLRHGQASLGTADYDRLSGLGQTQSRLLGKRLAGSTLPGDMVWCGAMRRHRQTLECLSIEAPKRIDQSLNEYTVDELIRSAVGQAEQSGLDLPDSRIFADPATHLATLLGWFPEVLGAWQEARFECLHNGTWQAFRQRVTGPVEQWQQALGAGQNVTVVTSAGVISTITAELLDKRLTWQRELNVALYNASVTELVMENGTWSATTINCIQHLNDPELQTLA